jgi:hypothetical protein
MEEIISDRHHLAAQLRAYSAQKQKKTKFQTSRVAL